MTPNNNISYLENINLIGLKGEIEMLICVIM